MDLSVQGGFLRARPDPGCPHKRQSIHLTAKKEQIKSVSWPKQLLCPIVLWECSALRPVLRAETTSLSPLAPENLAEV